MNLRKDHYRSFTRTMRTVSFLFLSVGSLVTILWIEHPASAGTTEACTLRRAGPPEERLRAPRLLTHPINHTTLVDGYLGMSNDEERSEMRYVVRIAEFSESSNL